MQMFVAIQNTLVQHSRILQHRSAKHVIQTEYRVGSLEYGYN